MLIGPGKVSVCRTTCRKSAKVFPITRRGKEFNPFKENGTKMTLATKLGWWLQDAAYSVNRGRDHNQKGIVQNLW
jgi:hypothetical protein